MQMNKIPTTRCRRTLASTGRHKPKMCRALSTRSTAEQKQVLLYMHAFQKSIATPAHGVLLLGALEYGKV